MMDTQKKYEFTGKTKIVHDIKLKQIVAIKDFNLVKAGDIGGWIESENNLSHLGNAWVSDDANVYGDALVCDNANVQGYANVYEDAKISDNAKVSGNASVYGHANVYDNVSVSGNTKLLSDADIKKKDDYVVVDGIGYNDNSITFFKCSNKVIKVVCGDFFGTIEEFRANIKDTYNADKQKNVCLAMTNIVELQLNKDV